MVVSVNVAIKNGIVIFLNTKHKLFRRFAHPWICSLTLEDSVAKTYAAALNLRAITIHAHKNKNQINLKRFEEKT
jgi:hypothetical protein